MAIAQAFPGPFPPLISAVPEHAVSSEQPLFLSGTTALFAIVT